MFGSRRSRRVEGDGGGNYRPARTALLDALLIGYGVRTGREGALHHVLLSLFCWLYIQLSFSCRVHVPGLVGNRMSTM